MTEYTLEKARQLKLEGNDFSKIRIYLSNAGISDDDISEIFRKIDNEEIHELNRKQQISKARTELIASIIFIIIGLSFNSYRVYNDEGINLFSILIPISTFIYALNKYKRTLNTSFTPSKILKYNRRNKAGQ